MVNGERTLGSMATKEGIHKFMVALQKPKEEDLHSRHRASGKPSGGAGGSLPSQESGSRISKRVLKSGRRLVYVLDDDEASEEENSTAFESDEDEDKASSCSRENQRRKELEVLLPPPRMKLSGQSSTSGRNLQEAQVTRSDTKSAVLELQKKEIELLKRRAETAEGNFVALVGRVQDFRTSLRSEIRTMPPGVELDGLSRLSAAMETTIDDGGLYLRNISDPLKQSRTNWEIHNGTEKTKVQDAKELEGGSKEQPRITGTVQRRIQRSRSPSPILILPPADRMVGKGKRKAVELSEDDEKEVQKKLRGINEDWEDPKIPVRPTRPVPKRTGEFFDKPCSTCVLYAKKCEKDKSGSACVQCKVKKRKCDHSQMRQAKKNATDS